MRTSKLTSLLILFGLLTLIGLLSFPVQAKTADPQMAFAAPTRAITKTKRVKPTSPPKTATPKPANTATKSSGGLNTPIPQTSSTAKVVPTGTGPTAAPTITATAASTLAARQTGTAQSSFRTSTALASLYTATPTNFGAATATSGTLELTATSAALTATPTGYSRMTTQYSSPGPSSSINIQAAAGGREAPAFSDRRWIFWVIVGCSIVLLALFFMLYLEWKKGRKN